MSSSSELVWARNVLEACSHAGASLGHFDHVGIQPLSRRGDDPRSGRNPTRLTTPIATQSIEPRLYPVVSADIHAPHVAARAGCQYRTGTSRHPGMRSTSV